jgi:hypothetical protein
VVVLENRQISLWACVDLGGVAAMTAACVDPMQTGGGRVDLPQAR